MPFVRFLQDRTGGVAPLLGLGLIPLVGAVGAAVDYSRADAARIAMQSAADAATLMMLKGAQGSNSPAVDNANAYFNANFSRPEVQDVQVSIATSPAPGGVSLKMTANGSIKTQFMALMGFSVLSLSVSSTALAYADGLGCVLSLDPNASGAMAAQGSASVNLKGCSLYDNSQSESALTVGGSARISGLSVGVVGGISGSSNITASQGIKTGIGPVADPYAAVSLPTFFGCKEENFRAKEPVTINPGVYCGGITAQAGAEITLNPGIYYLDGGSLSVNGGAAISGTGVTLVFTKKTEKNWATAAINGNASVNLTPPKSGPTAGIVMFGDRGIPVGTSFKFNGGINQYLGGAVYLPTAAIDFSGGAGAGTSCTQLIGNTVKFSGNSSLAIDCSSFGTKPFSPWVIKLTS